jgi:hypothetical protein
MSATQRFHEVANDALVMISEQLWPGAKLCLTIYTKDKPGLDIVFKDLGVSLDEVLSTLRRVPMSIDGANIYKRDLCDSIIGSIAFGYQNTNPPPEGHWAKRFWDIGRAEGAARDELRGDLAEAAEILRRYETLHRAKGTDDSTAKAEANAALASRFEATLAKYPPLNPA